MFCRFCGTPLVPDSVFCSKCGKKLIRQPNPRIENAVRVLRLRTPYPYAAMLGLLLFGAIWMLAPAPPSRTDYSNLKWTLQQDRSVDIPQEGLFRQGLSLVLENTGAAPVREVRVDLVARIEPQKAAEVEASLEGDRLPILKKGKPFPLTVILTDAVPSGKKRSFSIEGTIQAEPPFEVIYEVREEDSETILAAYPVKR